MFYQTYYEMNHHQKKRFHLIIGIFFLCIGISLIGVSSFYYQISFFVTPSTLKETPKKNFLRLGGIVQKGSFKKTEKGYTFVVKDEKENICVHYTGLLPPLFKEEQGIVVEGKLNEDQKLFMATKVFAKHDETYMPQSLVKELKENGRWKNSNSY